MVRMIMHYILVSCTIMHYILVSCTIMNYILVSCTIMRYILVECMIMHYILVSWMITIKHDATIRATASAMTRRMAIRTHFSRLSLSLSLSLSLLSLSLFLSSLLPRSPSLPPPLVLSFSLSLSPFSLRPLFYLSVSHHPSI